MLTETLQFLKMIKPHNIHTIDRNFDLPTLRSNFIKEKVNFLKEPNEHSLTYPQYECDALFVERPQNLAEFFSAIC